MSSRVARIDTGVGVSFIFSAVIHLAVFLLLAWWGRLFPPQMTIQETYYVDVVTLPTASPETGSSAQKTGETAMTTPPVTAPPQVVLRSSKTPPMVLEKPVKSAKPAKPTALQESAETESAFAERMAKLESSTEARHEEAVLEKLRNRVKVSGNSKTTVSGVNAAEAGSRYTDYIKSRLEDALKITSSYTAKNPEVAVRLTIGADGRLSRIKIERSSGDATFELAVRRAIDLASEKFTAPPSRTVFENGFVFKPRGISNGALR